MQTFQVLLQATGQSFTAREDESLLPAAHRAAVAMPSSCRNGTCRTCMRQLATGAVSYAIEWPGLSADEKAEGWILPCVARARSDLVLIGDAQRAWWEK